MADVVELITNLGYPIAISLLMGWYIKYTNDNHREDINNLITSHSEELNKFNESIDANTQVLQSLVDKIGG